MTAATSARKLEYMPVAELQPAESNPKEHDEPLLDDSIGRFGYVEPVVLDERTGKLVAGHGRKDALLRLQETGAAPPEGVQVDKRGRWLVPVLRGWASRSDEEASAFLVAVNRIGEKGGWQPDALYGLLDQLSQSELGLTGVGFDDADLDDLLAEMQERSVEFDPTESYSSKEGAHAELPLDERAAQYARKGIRGLSLDYKLDDFDVIAADCARLRRARGFETNADLIFALVHEAAVALPSDA